MGFIKRYKWHKVADNSANLNLPAGNIIRVEVDGKPVCLGRFKEQLYGFAAECPHAGADMTDGYIDGSCRVVCAVHSLRFDLRNGLDANGEGYKLKTYPVEVREDGIYVGVEEGSKFKWF